MSEELYEGIPSMDEFKDELEHSFQTIREGDLLKGTVIGISETEVTLDLGYYTEGIIPADEVSFNPAFSMKADIAIGDTIHAEVIREDDGKGNILLSKKRADDVLAWDVLKEALKMRTIYSVKIAEAVNAGVITYVEGLRAFIPASALSLSYVEDVSEYVGKTLDVIVITADPNGKKLVLSAKEVEKDKASKEKAGKISNLQKGIVTTGTVESIMPYGAFVRIGDGLSGLVHISQICGKHIKSPNEVLKEGQEVTVKIIDIKDGKISLSIKEAGGLEEVLEDVADAASEYTSGGEAATGLASLLANFKL